MSRPYAVPVGPTRFAVEADLPRRQRLDALDFKRTRSRTAIAPETTVGLAHEQLVVRQVDPDNGAPDARIERCAGDVHDDADAGLRVVGEEEEALAP